MENTWECEAESECGGGMCSLCLSLLMGCEAQCDALHTITVTSTRFHCYQKDVSPGWLFLFCVCLITSSNVFPSDCLSFPSEASTAGCISSLHNNFFVKFDIEKLTRNTLSRASRHPNSFLVLWAPESLNALPQRLKSSQDICAHMYRSECTIMISNDSSRTENVSKVTSEPSSYYKQ